MSTPASTPPAAPTGAAIPGAAATPPTGAAAPKDPETARREAITEQLTRAEQAARQKRFGEAVGICQDVLEANPGLASAFAVYGAIEAHRGRTAEATRLLETAVKGDPSVASWHGNLSGLYRVQYRLDDALAAAREAVRLRSDLARNHVNLGKVLVDRGERDEALTAFFAALACDPENAEGHLAVGQILLARGDMRPGWVEYEWRNKLEQAKGMLPRMIAPLWNGMRLPEQRILLVGDQGYGDTLQFARYIPLVAERCKEVVVGCSPDLLPLLRSIRGVGTLHTRWNEIPRHTAYSLMSSLPGILGTTPETIPSEVPYLRLDPALVQDWAGRLKERLEDGRLEDGRLRVGLVWAGRPTHPNDARRSMRLADLVPLTRVESIRLVSLQKVVPARDTEARAAMPDLIDVSQALTDFAQTAAAIVNLDLVVTVDSAVAHLAGALGKPVWVMLPRPSDWRWLLDRTDSPWYPTMRLIRQPHPGDWGNVVSEVAGLLARARRVPARPAEVSAEP